LNPIETPDGLQVLCAIIDITTRKAAAEQFRIAVEASPSGMLQVDRSGRILLVNAETERLFGYRREELIGKSVEMLVPERFRGPHPNLRDSFVRNPTRRSMGAGRELFGLRSDGTEFPVELGLNPIETPDGLQVLCAIIDITTRKAAAEQFRIAVEASPSGVLLVDERGKITLANAEAERLFGYDRAELIGNMIEMVVPVSIRDQHSRWRGEFMSTPTRRSMGLGRDLYALRRDGSVFPVEVGLNPIPTPDGVRVLCAVIDITGRKAAEHSLAELHSQLQERQLQKMEAISRMACGVGHDFVNLLTVVSGGLEMLDMSSADQRSKDILSDMSVATEHAAKLVEQLMAFSTDTLHKREVFDLNALVAESGSILRRLVGEELELEVVPEREPCYVDANRPQIEQVLMNLAVNARDATARHGKIQLEVRNVSSPEPRRLFDAELPAGSYAVILVADDGKGMDESTLQRIFEPFFTTKSKDHGTGMGLAAVYGIVRQNGGFIDVESTLGLGTKFHIYLPQATP
jgi:PAS domain S-box-containing protein